MFAPITLQDRPASLSIFHRAIVGPGMNFEPAFAFTSAIRKNIVRPPALEISAAPDCNVLNVRELKRAVDPSATAPFRRTNVPVRVIIKRNENDWFIQPPKPERAEVMKVARAIKNKRRKFLIEPAVEFLD
jgi:hypothetical protein